MHNVASAYKLDHCLTNGHPWWFLCGMVGGAGRLSFPHCQGSHAEWLPLVGAFDPTILPGCEVPFGVQCRVQYGGVSTQGETIPLYR